MALSKSASELVSMRGLVTDADLAEAEKEWPGLREFLDHLPLQQRPGTFLELVWRFEREHLPWNEQRVPHAPVLERAAGAPPIGSRSSS
jgi:hypothetical protein